jgi:hypothetical protein
MQSNRLDFVAKGPYKSQPYLTDDDHEKILVDETLSKLAAKDEELDQLLLSAGCDPRTRMNLECNSIMRAINSSYPLKKFEDLVSSLRRGYDCAICI